MNFLPHKKQLHSFRSAFKELTEHCLLQNIFVLYLILSKIYFFFCVYIGADQGAENVRLSDRQ